MKIGSHDTNDFSPVTKLLLVMGAIILLSLPYITRQVSGLTQIGTVIRSNPDLEDGLVKHFTFDSDYIDTSNTSAEIIDSISGITLDWRNHSSTTVPGVIGQGILFDGSDDQIRTTTKIDDSEQGTIAAWIKRNSGAGAGSIVGHGGQSNTTLLCYIDSSGKLTLYKRDSGSNYVTGHMIINPNEWTHVVCMSDGTSWRLYVNGVEQTLSTIGTNSGDWFADTNPPETDYSTIGYYYRWGLEETYFDGAIDDVRIYDRDLSNEEVMRLYQMGATTHISTTIDSNQDLRDGLINHYTFDGEQDTALVDSSGNDNHGILIAPANPTTTKPGNIGQSLFLSGDNYDAGVAATTGSLSESTACLWVYMESLDANDDSVYVFVALSDSMYLGYNKSTDKFRYVFDTDATAMEVESATEPSAKEWYHLCVTYEGIGTNATMYVNGVSDNGSPDNAGSGSPTLTDTNVLVIGSVGGVFPGNNGNPNSRLDDIRYYDRVLSTDEIVRLYQLGATTKIGVTQKQNPDLNQDTTLINHWTFDGKDTDLSSTTAEIIDIGSHGNNGNWIDHATTSVPGVLGQAIRFDGVDDYINVPVDDTDYLDDITIALWAKIEKGGDENQFVAKHIGSGSTNNPFDFRTGNQATPIMKLVRANVGGYRVWDGPEVTLNEWKHYAVTIDATEINSAPTFYIDGVATVGVDGGGSGTGDVTGSDADIRIGYRDDTDPIMEGVIDDVRIYNRVLSVEELQRLYELGQ